MPNYSHAVPYTPGTVVPAVLYVAALVYALNVAVGLGAQFGGMRFGPWHHILYAVVCITAGAALVFAFEVGLLVTVAALAAFPFARPRTPLHPSLAAVGATGYVLALLAHAR